MGIKNQITIKDDSTIQSQGVCEKIFKLAMNKSPTFQSFRRILPDESPKFATNSAKSSISKPIALHELNCQKIPLQDRYQNLSSASNMVLVEYNHIAGDMNSATTDHKFKDESMKAMNKSSVKNMITIVHDHEINEGPKDDNERFSNYIDHVKNKMRKMSSFDDDHKVTHHYIIDRSKINNN